MALLVIAPVAVMLLLADPAIAQGTPAGSVLNSANLVRVPGSDTAYTGTSDVSGASYNYTSDPVVSGILTKLNLGAWPLEQNNVSQAGPGLLRNIFPSACHSHNDEWRTFPLVDGLLAGCVATEADTWYVGDNGSSLVKPDLYLGHDAAAIRTGRTLRQMYIEPLRAILDAKNLPTKQTQYLASVGMSSPAPNAATNVQGLLGGYNGVFDTAPQQTLYLQVDLKNRDLEGWLAVVDALQPLREKGYLSYVETQADGSMGGVQVRPITVTAGGVAPRSFFLTTPNATYTRRDTFYDAPIASLNTTNGLTSPDRGWNSSTGITSSASWASLVSWDGKTSSPSDADAAKLRSLIKAAADRGIVSRFWDTPNRPRWARNNIWQWLQKEHVSLVNTDEPGEFVLF
ncbi:hypothetical protein PYCC9005_003167 [Savitreella phatthalungensis]